MLRKALDDVAHTDISDLVANKIMESRTLEYKRDLPGGADRDKKEFLADVTSFANAQGGEIIYGISEQTGWASELVGVSSDDPDAILLKMEALILSSVEPRIPGVRIRWIEGPPDVLIIRVPASPVAPHRVTYQNSGRFYGRKSNGKYEMDSYELRDAFVAADALPTRLKNLHFDAVEMADGDPLPISLGDDPRAIVSVMPLNFFRESRDLPITPENALMPIKPGGHAEFLHMSVALIAVVGRCIFNVRPSNLSRLASSPTSTCGGSMRSTATSWRPGAHGCRRTSHSAKFWMAMPMRAKSSESALRVGLRASCSWSCSTAKL